MEEPIAFDMLSKLTASLRQAGGEITCEPMFEQRPGKSYADFLIDARFSDAAFKLVVEAKRSAFPRDVREAIWQLKRYIAAMPPGNARVLPLLMADTISPGARVLLREENIGYFDRSGSLCLSADNLFVLVEKPASRQQARSLNNRLLATAGQAFPHHVDQS